MKVLQVGSNKGYDALAHYLKATYEQLEFALFVEANSLHMNSLKECYSNYTNAIFENIAIKEPTDNNKSLTIYYHINDGPNYEVASCKKQHVRHHYNEGEIKSFSVPCLTLEDLFEKYNIVDLDWLLLDVEGIDAELALSFPWSKYNITRVEVEHLHLGDKRETIESLFLSMGYKKINSLHQFDWAFSK